MKTHAFFGVFAVVIAAGSPLALSADGCDAAAGERQFRKCAVCHVIEQGADATIGPNLYGLVGRAVASASGFPYSEAMESKTGIWSVDQLDAFIRAPADVVPGTSMAFGGLKNDSARRNIICYLSGL